MGSGESGGGLVRDVWADGRSRMCMHRVTRGARATARDVPAENVVILRTGDFMKRKCAGKEPLALNNPCGDAWEDNIKAAAFASSRNRHFESLEGQWGWN